MSRPVVFLSFFLFLLRVSVNGVHQDRQLLYRQCLESKSDVRVYDYSLFDIEDDNKENELALDKYRGKTLVVVNTATYCGYTHQYPFFSELKNHYSEDRFEILAVPCNQFGLQEPGETGAEILNGIRFVRPGRNYIPNFEMFQRLDVNGVGEHPLFTFLKSLCPSPIDEFHPYPNITYVPVRSNDIRWNFEKFLIDSTGRPVKRFSSDVTPDQLLSHIDQIMPISTRRTPFQ